ncbi:MAG: site-2 protease family protein [Gammaproteobacteria bacterium]
MTTMLLEILLSAVPIIFAVTLHEVGHGVVAKWLGDPTAAMQGRLTANPLKHVDPVGTLLVPLLLLVTKAGFIFGWAKPVPIDWRNFKKLRRDLVLVALAGPGANVAQILFWVGMVWAADGLRASSPGLADAAIAMAQVGIIANLALAAFNLLPLLPLDGGRVAAALLPRKIAISYSKLEPFGLVIIVVLLATGWLSAVLIPVLQAGLHLVYSLLPG